MASVNESAITGESAPVIREPILGGTGHFEVIAPGSPVWSQVEAFLLEQLKVEK